jgi:hypothetical protein
MRLTSEKAWENLMKDRVRHAPKIICVERGSEEHEWAKKLHDQGFFELKRVKKVKNGDLLDEYMVYTVLSKPHTPPKLR